MCMHVYVCIPLMQAYMNAHTLSSMHVRFFDPNSISPVAAILSSCSPSLVSACRPEVWFGGLASAVQACHASLNSLRAHLVLEEEKEKC